MPTRYGLARATALLLLVSTAQACTAVDRPPTRELAGGRGTSSRTGIPGASDGLTPGHPRLFLGERPFHPRIRSVVLSPGERLRLSAAWWAEPPPPVAADRFDLRLLLDAETIGLGWTAEGGTIVGTWPSGTGLAHYVAPPTPGAFRLRLHGPVQHATHAEFQVLVRTPFGSKRQGVLSGYLIGDYPQDLGLSPPVGGHGRWLPVRGFVAVTPDDEDVPLTDHFRVRDFLCKQQPGHYPKYLVLDVRLLDKLERIIDELIAGGHPVTGLAVMSGYRTPYYNRAIGNDTTWSRHTTGEAADVFVDEDRNGLMDDLNADGRADRADAEVLLRAVERVDADPWLAGGAATYAATAAHGPFVHVDIRGHRTRW